MQHKYNLVEVGMDVLAFIRQRPGRDGKISYVVSAVVLFLTLHQFVLIAMLAVRFNGDITLLVTCIESFSTYFMMVVKLVPLTIHKARLAELIERSKLFWDPHEFPEILEKTNLVYKLTYYWMSSFKYMCRVTIILFYALSLYKRELLLQCYVPQFKYGWYYVQTVEYLYGTTYSFYVIGFDSIFVAFSGHLVIQLKIVNWVLANMSSKDPNYLIKLKKCIQHHEFLLEFADEMTSIYTISLMGQYLISIYLTCMELYLVMESNVTERQITSIFYIVSLSLQFAQYCFPSAEITQEAENLAVSVYHSDWYDADSSIQKNVRLIMMRAQKEFNISAGGMVNINREAFVVVMKASMSFYTLLRQLNDE